MSRLDPGQAPVAILAGGEATRLGPAAAHTAKALLEVGGRPFIDHQLEVLRRQGVRKVVLCLGHLGEQVEAHVRSRPAGLAVEFSYDGARPLGTAGALKKAAPRLGPLFWVLYGDSYVDVDLGAVLAALPGEGALGVMTVLHNRGRWDRSNALFRGGRLLAYDKRAPTPEMEHVDYGLSLLRQEALAHVPEGEPYDLADLYHGLVTEGRLAGCEVGRRFYEIGSPEGLAETCRFLGERAAVSEHTTSYLRDAALAIERIDTAAVERMVTILAEVRERGGRLFVLGVGGSAANASHAVNDFRKICGLEAYTPTDNVAELTARVNDEGWEGVFADWLRGSRLGERDAVLVFSVGGGDRERGVSANLVRALEHAREVGARVCGVVGRTGGYTAQVADACVVVPTVNREMVTAHTEALQAVVWHLMVTHPALRQHPTTWESL